MGLRRVKIGYVQIKKTSGTCLPVCDGVVKWRGGVSGKGGVSGRWLSGGRRLDEHRLRGTYEQKEPLLPMHTYNCLALVKGGGVSGEELGGRS